MKKVLLVSTFDYPTRYAHARHGLEMARAYHAIFGADFLFMVNTAVDGLAVPYARLFGSFGRHVKLLHFRRLLVPVRLFLFLCVHPGWRILITTDPMLYAPLGFLKRLFRFQLIVECHGSLTPAQERALHRADLAIFTTPWLRDRYATHTSLRSRVVPNAVDLAAFLRVREDPRALRAKHALPSEVMLVGYIGRFEPLQTDKGLRFLIDALAELPDAHLLLLGGARHEIPAYEEYARKNKLETRVHIRGHVNADVVPEYAKACDLLAYVPVERTSFFEQETSPMKLFEYMAAERPIVCADTPALREVLDDTSAFFIRPGAVDEFVRVVKNVQRGAGSDKAREAFKKVHGNTWNDRARRIVQALPGVL